MERFITPRSDQRPSGGESSSAAVKYKWFLRNLGPTPGCRACTDPGGRRHTPTCKRRRAELELAQEEKDKQQLQSSQLEQQQLSLSSLQPPIIQQQQQQSQQPMQQTQLQLQEPQGQQKRALFEPTTPTHLHSSQPLQRRRLSTKTDLPLHPLTSSSSSSTPTAPVSSLSVCVDCCVVPESSETSNSFLGIQPCSRDGPFFFLALLTN